MFANLNSSRASDFFFVFASTEEGLYQGHRNSRTVKGCSWFGDDFVISGSDDGYIYGWDRESQHIVMSSQFDENGEAVS